MKIRRFFRLFSALFVLLALSQLAVAESDRYVRLRHVEGDVRIQPSDGERPEEAAANYPVLDGDEIVTEEGRAELSFRNGVVVRIGDYSVVRLESAYTPVRIVLLEGTLFVDSHLIDSFRDELEVQAGDAQINLIDEGNLRVDLGREGSVRVTTIEGEAEVRAGGRRVLLERGERTYIDPGESPERAEEIYGDLDELDEWNEDRMGQYARYDDRHDDYVDDSVYYDAYDLSGYGDWREYGTYGHVWVPHVSDGWRPYYDGRWMMTRGSWFWHSYEPWGWAPYHYGRWGWDIGFGWYWIPGNSFAPAWVSWYDYGDYIGWCPLDYYNRPFYGFGYGGYGGGWGYGGYNNRYRLPSLQKQKTIDITDTWTFVKKRELGADNIKKISIDPGAVRKIKLDRNRVVRNPKKELVSYVLPKNAKVRGYVNDHKTVKQRPDDIRNPYGIKNRDDDFRRGKITDRDLNSKRNRNSEDVTKKPTRIPERGWEKDRAEKSNRNERVDPRIIDRRDVQKNRDVEKNQDRDSQFDRKRGSSNRKPPSESGNPYYKDRTTRSKDRDDFRERDTRSDDWRNRWGSPRESDPRKNDRSRDEERREVSPRYLDEARKIFERLEEQRSRERNESKREEASPRWEPPSRERSYEPSRREYKAEPRRENPKQSQPKNNNNSRNNSNRKPPKQKD